MNAPTAIAKDFSNVTRSRFARAAGVLCLAGSIGLTATACAEVTFINSWGQPGTGDGEFSFGSGSSVSVGPTGDVFVADTNNHRIQKFNNAGLFISKWGSMGTGDGQFDLPAGVEVSSTGDVYVADYSNHRVQKFDEFGTFITKWGTPGAGDGQFNLPQGVTVSSAGDVYVSDFDRVQRFTSDGTFVADWGSFGTGDGQFDQAFDVAINSAGEVFVSDFGNDRIQKFDGFGTFLTKWGITGNAFGQFQSAAGLAINGAGQIYVVDALNNRVQKFDDAGNFISSFGQVGLGDGQFTFPLAAAVSDAGEVYVSDSSARIQRFFDPDAWLQGVYPVSASATIGPGTPLGETLVVGQNRNLQVTDQTVVDAGGTLTLDGGSFVTTDLSGQGSVQFNSGSLDVTGNTTTLVVGPGALLGPTLVLDANSSIFAGFGFINDGSTTLSGSLVTVDAGLLNRGTFSVTGGTIQAFLGMTNDYGALMNAHGSMLVGSATFTNNGTLRLTGLWQTPNFSQNYGLAELPTGTAWQFTGGMENFGLMELTGGAMTGAPGFIEVNRIDGTIRGFGAVSLPFLNEGLVHATGGLLVLAQLNENRVDGHLQIDDFSTMRILNTAGTWNNMGEVSLNGANAKLTGDYIANTGLVRGVGQIAANVSNSGVIRAEGGTLSIGEFGQGSPQNTLAGRIEAPAGATVRFTRPISNLDANEGDIILTGGTFDHDVGSFTNNGNILGEGTLRSGGLTNDNLISFADGDTDVFGPVTNNATLNVTDNTTTFFGAVTNSATGTIKNTGATARFLAGLTNNGAFISDPADNLFTDLDVSETGYLVGGVGDRFLVSGDFTNQSTQTSDWETTSAELVFQGGTSHLFELAGDDLGQTSAGFDDNFAWGILRLEAADSLVLADGNIDTGAAAYVSSLILDGGLAQIGDITGNGFNIYYDPNAAANAYLGANVFALSGGGMIAPVLTTLLGDFDFDGDVDGFDFLLWQQGGSPNPFSQSDLADWEANYGTVAPLSAVSAAVPEPSTFVLFLCLAKVGMLARRRTRQ